MKTYGAIDIGSNSVLLLVGRVDESGYIEPAHEDLRVTRIGRGVYDTKLIKEEGIAKTLEVLRGYIKKCKESGVEEIRAVGTSALRMAKNSEHFLNLVKEEVGITVQIITGEKEAELSFIGAISGIEDKKDNAVIIDIGGGSTEIIFGSSKKILHMKSLEIGSVRLTESFLKSDPPLDDEIRKMRGYIRRSFKSLSSSVNVKNILIGVAGTVTTLSQIYLGIPGYDRLKIEKCKMKIGKLRSIISLLKQKNLNERKKIVGLEPDRADVIIAGAIIVEEVMSYLGFDEITVSTRGLRYGLIKEMAENVK